MRLTNQAIAFQIALLLVVVLLSLVASTAVLRSDLKQEYEQRALAIARSVAQRPGLPRLVSTTAPDVHGPVQREAEQVRRATHALYVVITDRRGIRYSHPDPSRVGRHVSTDPSGALSGREVVAVERGTLGLSARGKVPLRAADGTVVGEVSVGIDVAQLNAQTRKLVELLVLVALACLGVGLAGAVTLARRLRRTTLGLEPEEMADLLREHAAVLGGVRDGIVAVDHAGRVTLANREAEQILGTHLEPGSPVADGPAAELFAAEPRPAGALRVIGDKVVLVTRLPVQRDGRDLGEVVTMRDRSDLDDLARELEATRALTDALRAQGHEHANRLHALTGLLHVGDVEQAREYLAELTTGTAGVAGVDDPYLAGLLAAKSASASESGVRLDVSAATWVDGRLGSPLDAVTVVGNLVDNAVRAAAAGRRRPAWVEVTLLCDGDDLLVHVVDSGDGVPARDVGRLFEAGFTTRDTDAARHGIGLVLARQTARSHGGDVELLDAGGDEHGAVFRARMGGALSRPAPVASEVAQ